MPSKNAVSANIKHIVDTFIKHPISSQSTIMVKGCMYIMFDMVDTSFDLWKSIDRLLISSGIFPGKYSLHAI